MSKCGCCCCMCCTYSDQVEQWKNFVSPNFLQGHKALVICNPVSGSGDGKNVFDIVVQPMFDHSGLRTDVIFTEHADHGYSLGMTFNMEEWNYIFFISGDGLMHETIQGWANKYETKQEMLDFLEGRCLGHIPAGTSNSLPCSLARDANGTGKINPVEFVERMLSNIENNTPLDVDLYTVNRLGGGYQNENGVFGGNIQDTPKLARDYVWDVILSSWGLVAEVDFMQEGCLRCLPACCRETVGAVIAITQLNTHEGTVKFIFADDHNSPLPVSDLSLLERDGDYYCLTGEFVNVMVSPLNYVTSDFSVNPGKKTDACGWLGLSMALAGGVGRCKFISLLSDFEHGTQYEHEEVLYYPIRKMIISKTTGCLNTCGTYSGEVGSHGDHQDPAGDFCIEVAGRLKLL